jgi:membrane protein implicated in regulation of membrane protease activity
MPWITRRELAFLLIGLGMGLLLSAAAIVEFFRHMYIIGFQWRAESILLVSLPFLLMLAGTAFLRTGKKQKKSRLKRFHSCRIPKHRS